jgi:hypothetical protein
MLKIIERISNEQLSINISSIKEIIVQRDDSFSPSEYFLALSLPTGAVGLAGTYVLTSDAVAAVVVLQNRLDFINITAY